jgi:hypothetical protein
LLQRTITLPPTAGRPLLFEYTTLASTTATMIGMAMMIGAW